MKTKKFILYYNGDGGLYDKKEMLLSDAKVREVFGIDMSQYRAPYSLKLSSSSKQKYCAAVDEVNNAYYIMMEWQEVPESEKEIEELVKKYIREARNYFSPNNSDLSAWLSKNCQAEWLFEKHMKEGKYLMALEELHVMTQCFYGQAVNEPNITRNLNEARKLLAIKL
jgi:hypothetical protein